MNYPNKNECGGRKYAFSLWKAYLKYFFNVDEADVGVFSRVEYFKNFIYSTLEQTNEKMTCTP